MGEKMKPSRFFLHSGFVQSRANRFFAILRIEPGSHWNTVCSLLSVSHKNSKNSAQVVFDSFILHDMFSLEGPSYHLLESLVYKL